MDEPIRKRARVEREEWAKRVERWRSSGLTTAAFSAELGINPRTLTYWAWMLKREEACLVDENPEATGSTESSRVSRDGRPQLAVRGDRESYLTRAIRA